MLRFLILEVILPILAFTLVRAVIRSLLQGFKTTSAAPQPVPRSERPVHAGGELKKDPVCGIYVSTAVSVTKKVDGELVHFCSKECRDRYHAA